MSFSLVAVLSFSVATGFHTPPQRLPPRTVRRYDMQLLLSSSLQRPSTLYDKSLL